MSSLHLEGMPPDSVWQTLDVFVAPLRSDLGLALGRWCRRVRHPNCLGMPLHLGGIPPDSAGSTLGVSVAPSRSNLGLVLVRWCR